MILNHNSAGHLGGAEFSLFAIVDRWAAQRPELRPIVVSPGPAPAVEAETVRRGWRHVPLHFEGWAVFEVSGGRAQERLRERAAARATHQLIALLRETRAALVVTNTLIHPWAAIAAAATGVPHLWFVREFGHRDQGVIFPKGRATALRQIGELSQAVVANSIAVRDDLAAEIPPAKLTVSYPPVDLPSVREHALAPLPSGALPFPDPAALRVAVPGRVTRSKGQWRVVEALGLLSREGVPVQAVFIGALLDPGVEGDLRRRASALGVAENIVFAGEQANPFPWIAAAEVAVIPSQREAFGRTTLECLALGRPVIATRQGAGAELVTTGAGELFDAEDVTGLAVALRRYCGNRSLAPQQASTARARAEELSTGPFSITAAIEALDASIGTPPAVLPVEWADWVARLDRVANGGRPRWWGAQATMARGLNLGAKALREPRRALRRLRAKLRSGR